MTTSDCPPPTSDENANPSGSFNALKSHQNYQGNRFHYPPPAPSSLPEQGFPDRFTPVTDEEVGEDDLSPQYHQYHSKKNHSRKASNPYPAWKVPSSESDRINQGIVQLDVFGAYLRNPAQLLHKQPSSSRPSSRNSRTRNKASASKKVLTVITPMSSSGSSSPAPSPSSFARTVQIKPRDEANYADSMLLVYESHGLKFYSLSDKFDHILRGGFVPLTYDLSRFRDTGNAPVICWKKGSPQAVDKNQLWYDQCTDEEIKIMSLLRLSPMSYLHLKETILVAQFVRPPFKKRDAKSWFRIDVNKTAVLYDWFRGLGWLPGSDEGWERRWASGDLARQMPVKLHFTHENMA